MLAQTTRFEQGNTMGLSPQEALVCLLIASARADGSVSSHEANQIEHTAAAMRLFHGSTHETRYGLFTIAAGRIKEHGIETVVAAAAAALPKVLGATAFAVAVDLMLSDGRLTANEERFADDLRARLSVDRETAARIVDVLTLKNAG